MAELRFGVVARGLVTNVEVGGDPVEDEVRAVSYTHLTLPTNREV